MSVSFLANQASMSTCQKINHPSCTFLARGEKKLESLERLELRRNAKHFQGGKLESSFFLFQCLHVDRRLNESWSEALEIHLIWLGKKFGR